MFEQEEDIADFFFFAQNYQLLLKAQASRVIDGAELEDGNHNFTSPRIHTDQNQGHFTTGALSHEAIASVLRFAQDNKQFGFFPRSSVLIRGYEVHALIAIPYTLFDASSMASASVGWAWMVHIKSSTVASSSMAVTASAISSVAFGPMIWTPRISPSSPSATILLKPSC